MISREKVIKILKVIMKGAWDKLPVILSVIPATAIAGKILIELKKIADDAQKAAKSSEETKAAVGKLVEESGGIARFIKSVKEELKLSRDPKNPKFINCALYTVKPGEALTEEEQDRIIAVLEGVESVEDEKLSRFVALFIDDYFGGDITACENACEIEAEYLGFNFDDSEDHDYSEEDLKLIGEELNKIVGRQVFDDYEGFGTDDSVAY